jgi:hypothetical protein
MVYLHEIAPGRAKGLVGSIGFAAAAAAAAAVAYVLLPLLLLVQASLGVPWCSFFPYQ